MMRITLVLLLFVAQDGNLSEARKKYPPEVTRGVLSGRIPAPDGFDAAIAKELGEKRRDALKAGADVDGRENDIAALCLLKLKAKIDDVRPGPRVGEGRVTVTKIESTHKVAPGKTSGFFQTGTDADIVLSAIDFNNAGGPLLFNHPMGIAGDGTRLFLADTYNNRVLVWNTAPTSNTPPDFVLGQKDFTGNHSGSGRDQMNFPVNITTDGKRLVVADTDNHRLLIWTSMPGKSGQPADLVITGSKPGQGMRQAKDGFQWPWGVWTDGEKLVLSSTKGGSVLIWNQFPTREDQPADLLLTGGGKLGTPRTITSDGKSLIVGDHNPKTGAKGGGSFFWRKFPTRDDEPYDFFATSPGGMGSIWLRGCWAPDGRLLLLAEKFHIFKGFPDDATTKPALTVTGWDIRGGDHVGTAIAGGRLYLCSGNWNKVVCYNEIPDKADAKPDFAIGSPDLQTDTLQANFIISNPAVASDGRSLFVTSDFDRKTYVWKNRPDQSGAHPDFVYSTGGLDVTIWKGAMAIVGRGVVHYWKKAPANGELPDVTFRGRIGSVSLDHARGVCFNDQLFCISDIDAGKIHVWKGIPAAETEPAFSLDVRSAGRLSTDGDWIAAAAMEQQRVLLWRMTDFAAGAKPIEVGGGSTRLFNLPSGAHVSGGHLFVADNSNHRVHAWKKIEDAAAGKRADVILGEADFSDVNPDTARNKVHMPASVWFDGDYLWVGEVKFSERLLRFSPRP